MGPCGAQFLPFSLPLFFFFSSLFFFFRFFFYKRRRFIGPEPLMGRVQCTDAQGILRGYTFGARRCTTKLALIRVLKSR